MNKLVLGLAALATITLSSCSSDDDTGVIIETNNVTAPNTYVFERDGNTTVSFSGQTTRIQMAQEIVSGLSNTANTETILDNMFAHQEGANDFSDAALNASNKSVRSKTAASTDYYAANTTDAATIKATFDFFIEEQVNTVFPNWDTDASAGVAGSIQEAGGGSTRYVSEKGLEYNQAFAKGLIGALMVDQIVNNYLSPAVLDAGDNEANNDADVLDGDNNYTTMEHKWDEAYGYLYGNEANPAVPVLGADNFLNKYLSRVENDEDFTGIAMEIYNAFKLGRAAIVAKDYALRDAQANIIKEKISEIIAVRAVYYLQQGKADLGSDWASAFHSLSEGYGFVYSLQFTRKPGTNEPYLSKDEVLFYTDSLMEGNGFWDITPETLDTISNEISAEFSFTTEQAGS
ncbi:DUF4856 domain-containing protein [Lacinutrix sp. 5H-3-7-4]|uniref:DUF4856 domain-containing protein n=1 Tax=Lacinutrix sp. (strain 5H-3-7-4) TaxID=983544 RepID=UPI00020A3777|nr:DUF4856 domain-containing protein [Lacinutrix sp. 5H-3-7-4]AEG99934.1 hypothetical protein Lacal_0082 [Lacinutrix sp. 5H-3-7-4]